MKLQHFIAATGILLSSNVVASAQFSLRSLIDGLTSKTAPAEENSQSQDADLPSPIDAPSLQAPPSPHRASVQERVDLDSLPTPSPTLALPSNASPNRPSQNNTLIHKQSTEHSFTHSLPNNPHSLAKPDAESSLSHSPVNLNCGQVDQNCSHSCRNTGTHNRCGCHHGQEKPIVCLDRPNIPPPVSSTDYYRTPLHYNNLWGDYLNEQVIARRKAYGSLLAPPKSVYESQCPSSQYPNSQYPNSPCGSSN